MRAITETQLKEICRNGKPIDMQGGYPCVVLHPNNTITKIWAIKKGLFSSATLTSYSSRFVKNATKLAARGITVPKLLDHAKVKNSHIKTVTYESLPGHSIRDLLKNHPQQIDIPDLCRYIFDLHEKGILFRSIHFGNIIQLPDRGYGLIDFTDVTFFNKPVPLPRRAANIAFPLRYPEDARRMKNAKLPKFRKNYLSLLHLNTRAKRQFKNVYQRYLKR